jgi:hypothetical protein
MAKFKVGDRVAVYGFRPRKTGSGTHFYSWGDRGEVIEIVNDDEIVVQFDDGTEGEVHPKQCRKLKSKERRRVFIPGYELQEMEDDASGTYNNASISKEAIVTDDVEFIEVRRKK